MTHLPNLAKPAFSLRFAELQIDLKATLKNSEMDTEALLTMQDRLILRLEGWVDSLADLHMLTTTDIDIFRHTLSTNRKIYRMRVLAMHNVKMSEAEEAALNLALHSAIKKICAAKPGAAMGVECQSAQH
jgi:hypothetical protein